MKNLFDSRQARVMLIGRQEQAFDDPDYIYELKLDGDRCLAYLDRDSTVLVNRRGREVLAWLPELEHLHRQTGQRCILDGELIAGTGTKAEFQMLRTRFSTKSIYRRQRLAQENPITFVAFDMLYLGNSDILSLPLVQRKELLQSTVREHERLTLSRFINGQGVAFFDLVRKQGLEGIVAKQLLSPYQMGRRSKDWAKIRNWLEDDFAICGFSPNENNTVSLVLGQYSADGRLWYQGLVTLGRGRDDFRLIESQRGLPSHPFEEEPPSVRHNTTWLRPVLACRVEFVCRTTIGLRQPVYGGLREDKTAQDCIRPENGPIVENCHS